MKIHNGKIIIGVEDLKRKVVLIKGYNNEEELQTSQVAVMRAVPGCVAISINSFDKLNKFRKSKNHKGLILEETMIVDIADFKKQEEKADKP